MKAHAIKKQVRESYAKIAKMILGKAGEFADEAIAEVMEKVA